MNKEKTNDRKITEFFENNNNIPLSKIGTQIQKTTNRSKPTTTKTYNNNNYHISKDRNNNSDSKYDGVSRNFKQRENSYSQEEIFHVGENRSESGTVSEEEKISSRITYYLPHQVLLIAGKKINRN